MTKHVRYVSDGRVFCVRDDQDAALDVCMACDRFQGVETRSGVVVAITCDRGSEPEFISEDSWPLRAKPA